MLKATYGYVERKKVNISCLEARLYFQKDTYGQSYTIAWRAKHFPAVSCSFFQNLGHPKNKIKTYSIISRRKKPQIIHSNHSHYNVLSKKAKLLQYCTWTAEESYLETCLYWEGYFP